MTIDWKRPVATITGQLKSGARYEQDGRQYRTDGTEINPEPEPVPVPVPEPEPVPVPEPELIPEPESAEVASLDEAIKEGLDLGLTHSEIASKFGITRQKVTAVARQLS